MRIAVIGGDERMLSAARGFVDNGFEVYTVGFDGHVSVAGTIECEAEMAAELCDIAVLPVRPLDGDSLFAPYSHDRIDIRELLGLLEDIAVYTGCTDMLRPYTVGAVYDYSVREDFRVYNAVLTAEGAVELALRESDISLLGSEILIAGYGRIGRALARRLAAFGAHINVAVRSSSAEAAAATDGFRTVGYPINAVERYDIIFNTVPAQVITAREIDMMDNRTLMIDLASAPGGVDHDRAAQRGVRCVHALALPGKTAPVCAGRIICDTVINMIKEGKGG